MAATGSRTSTTFGFPTHSVFAIVGVLDDRLLFGIPAILHHSVSGDWVAEHRSARPRSGSGALILIQTLTHHSLNQHLQTSPRRHVAARACRQQPQIVWAPVIVVVVPQLPVDASIKCVVYIVRIRAKPPRRTELEGRVRKIQIPQRVAGCSAPLRPSAMDAARGRDHGTQQARTQQARVHRQPRSRSRSR
jgi:hypothetical protein